MPADWLPWLAPVAASLLALLAGALLAAWLAMARFAGRRLVLAVLGAGAVVPVELWLSPAAQPGEWLAATAAVSAALVLLLAHGTLADSWARHGRGLQAAGFTRWRALRPMLGSARRVLLVAWLAALARELAGFAPSAAAVGLALAGVAIWLWQDGR